MSVIFSSPAQGIVVSRRSDGSQSCSGQYNGVAIKSAVAIDGGTRCILLLDPDANKRSAFQNLLCINQQGSTVWTAKLPASFDVFVAIKPGAGGVWANTWNGFRVLIDERTGAELKKIFTK